MDNLQLIHWLQQENIHYHSNHNIGAYLTMGIGGPVPLVAIVETADQLKKLLRQLHSNHTPFVLLGGGSNVIFPDSISQPNLTAIINRTRAIEKEEEGVLRVNSGVLNSRLMNWNIQNHIGSMDFMAGIPGTIGGAAAVNAGAFGKSISQILIKAEICDSNGIIKTVDNDYFQFQYRNSRFKYGNEAIIDVFLRYTPEESSQVKEKVVAKIDYRKNNHPDFNLKSAGCFFKNPVIDGQKISAGRLLEQSGFKGVSFHELRIAQEHANFVINNGRASFSDIKDMESKIRTTIDREKGIILEREVIYISPQGEKY